MKTLLIIGYTFPEPSTTAAGTRMMQLIDLFINDGYTIAFATTASASERSTDLQKLGISIQKIELNNSSFDEFLLQLKPTVVLFDRYITEEQFGWRVAENSPEALRILDTEDLHFLRKARQQAVNNNLPITKANLFTDSAKREIASIFRCDLSLIISEFEIELLQNTFSVSSKILHYLPLLVENSSKNSQNTSNFDKTSEFLTIGNLLHKPNVDSVLWLKKEIWPLIKNDFPEAVINIYGSYAPKQILDLHNEKEGFLIKGWAKSVEEVMQNSRICLAPIRFGAGLKGKLLEAMIHGTPAVTTTIGAEGMYGEFPIPGIVADTASSFAKASVELYSKKEKWIVAQENGFRIIENRFEKELFSEVIITRINALQKNLNENRKSNFIGQILQHQNLQSTKYMSKWIELKNKN